MGIRKCKKYMLCTGSFHIICVATFFYYNDGFLAYAKNGGGSLEKHIIDMAKNFFAYDAGGNGQ